MNIENETYMNKETEENKLFYTKYMEYKLHIRSKVTKYPTSPVLKVVNKHTRVQSRLRM